MKRKNIALGFIILYPKMRNIEMNEIEIDRFRLAPLSNFISLLRKS